MSLCACPLGESPATSDTGIDAVDGGKGTIDASPSLDSGGHDALPRWDGGTTDSSPTDDGGAPPDAGAPLAFPPTVAIQWAVDLAQPSVSSIWVSDFNQDGVLDAVIGCGLEFMQEGSIQAFDGRTGEEYGVRKQGKKSSLRRH